MDKENTIEELFSKIEETIQTLEADEISLEDSFLAYKKGMDLLKSCNEKIDTIEKKVLALNEEGELSEF